MSYFTFVSTGSFISSCDSSVNGSLSTDRWHSGHHILTSASATRAASCRRAWHTATGGAQYTLAGGMYNA